MCCSTGFTGVISFFLRVKNYACSGILEDLYVLVSFRFQISNKHFKEILILFIVNPGDPGGVLEWFAPLLQGRKMDDVAPNRVRLRG